MKRREARVIFIIRTQSAKYVTPYAPFGTDTEVMISTPTRFKVKRWYRGDPICLGQQYIREHTFGIKKEELVDYQNSDRALIIELEEISA